MSHLQVNERVVLGNKGEKQIVKSLDFGRSEDEYGPRIGIGITTDDGQTQFLHLPTEVAHIVVVEILQGIRTSEEHYRAKFGNWHDEFGFQTTEGTPAYEAKFGKRGARES
jgi:hypothetical protein